MHPSQSKLTRPYLLVIALLLISTISSGASSHTQEEKPTGMSIFGQVFEVHQDGTLTIFGDLSLSNTEVRGEGKLILMSHKPQHLFSFHSTVNHLEINNPATVFLEGDLNLTGVLVIRHGSFDTRKAHFSLKNGSIVRLLQGGTLMKAVDYRPFPGSNLITQSQHNPLQLVSVSAILPKPYTAAAGEVIFDQILENSLNAPSKESAPPPEMELDRVMNIN